MGGYAGRLPDAVMGRPWDLVMGHLSSKFFKINSQNTLNLPWQVSQDFIVNGRSIKISEQYSGYNNDLNINKSSWIHKDIIINQIWIEGPW